MPETKKVFIIFNTSFIGDTLIVNSLVQNIKAFYQNSMIVMVTPEETKEIAQFQYLVDDVITYNSKKRNCPCYFIKFVMNFKHKRPCCSFIINNKERELIIAKLICSRHIYTSRTNKLFSLLLADKNNNSRNSYKTAAENYSAFLEPLVKRSISVKPIRYQPPNINSDKFAGIKLGKYLAIIPANAYKVSSKNMPEKDFANLVQKLHDKYKIIVMGKGEFYGKYIDIMEHLNIQYLNFINKLSLIEAANVLKSCIGVISIDTGLMHMSYAMGGKTIALFYEKTLKERWAPDEQLYKNVKVLCDDLSLDAVISAMKKLKI